MPRGKKRARESPSAGETAQPAPAPGAAAAPATAPPASPPASVLLPQLQPQPLSSPVSPSNGAAPAPQATPPPSKKKLRPLPGTPSFRPASLDALRDKALRIQKQLAQLYPSPPIPLHHANAFQLLVAVMLSAQSTDVKVNQVTPELFAKGPDASAMAALEVCEIERIIRVLGLAPTKAKNVLRMSQLLVEQHRGQVPDSFDALEALPGVGHKTASVVMSQAFGRAAFPVDTHIHRLAQRWGLSNGKSVEQTEQDLKTLLPEETWRDAHLQMIYFGREHCPAQRHDAAACPICSWAAVGARGGRSLGGAEEGQPVPAPPQLGLEAGMAGQRLQAASQEPDTQAPTEGETVPQRHAKRRNRAKPADVGADASLGPFAGFKAGAARRNPRRAAAERGTDGGRG